MVNSLWSADENFKSNMLLKECGKCKQSKSILEFNKSKKGIGGLHTYCKPCQKVQDKIYWNRKKKDSVRMQERQALANQRRKEAQDFIFQYLISHPCSCGESNPLFLDFDHLQNKSDSISNLMKKQVSIDRLKEEIEKCQVLCVKCHRLKTAKDFGWWIYKRLNVG